MRNDTLLPMTPVLTVDGSSIDEAAVCSVGTLHGEWPDGTPFEGKPYVDRHVLSHALITQLEVWNHSAERLLVRAEWISP